MIIFLRKKLREKTKEEKVMELRKPGNKHRKKKKSQREWITVKRDSKVIACSHPRNQLVLPQVAHEALGKCPEKDEMTKKLSCLKTLRGNLSNWK